jgi:membrane-associated phospholipid phosphatase
MSMFGEEIFAFIPLLCWILPEIGLPYMTNFGIVLTLGQLAKDIFKLPRPKGLNVQKLEIHFGTEFGMPSTHTMAGFLPLSVVLRLHSWGYFISPLIWMLCVGCIVSVGMSRMYMGVHSIADITGGALLATILVSLIAYGGDSLDNFLYTSSFSVLLWILMMLTFLVAYPRAIPWSASIGLHVYHQELYNLI